MDIEHQLRNIVWSSLASPGSREDLRSGVLESAVDRIVDDILRTFTLEPKNGHDLVNA